MCFEVNNAFLEFYLINLLREHNNYEPGFMVDLMVKDLGLAKEVAGGAGVDNRLGRLALEIYQAHQAEGHGSLDFSSILNSVLEHSSQ